jgi:ribosomal protein S27AE
VSAGCSGTRGCRPALDSSVGLVSFKSRVGGTSKVTISHSQAAQRHARQEAAGAITQGQEDQSEACGACGYATSINVDAWPDVVPVPSFGPRMRCGRCGHLGATAIANWKERADYTPGGARYRARGQ